MEKPTRGIAVKGLCPGFPARPIGGAKYQGIDIETGEKLFYNSMPKGTNNIAEYIAVIHALQYCKKNMMNCDIYTDSQTAIAWIKKRQCNSSMSFSSLDKAGRLIRRCTMWLIEQKHMNEVVKWNTREWGEFPVPSTRD